MVNFVRAITLMIQCTLSSSEGKVKRGSELGLFKTWKIYQSRKIKIKRNFSTYFKYVILFCVLNRPVVNIPCNWSPLPVTYQHHHINCCYELYITQYFL